MYQKGSISSAFGIIVTLVIAAGVGGYIYSQSLIPDQSESIPAPHSHENKQPPSSTPSKSVPPQAVACTQEAKQCPDGSYVGRTGPKCAFAACLSAKSVSQSAIPTDWKTYTGTNYTFKYPPAWAIYPVYLNGSVSSPEKYSDLPNEAGLRASSFQANSGPKQTIDQIEALAKAAILILEKTGRTVDVITLERTTFAGYPALKVVMDVTTVYGRNLPTPIVHKDRSFDITVISGDKVYSLESQTRADAFAQYKDILEKIFSSFSF